MTRFTRQYGSLGGGGKIRSLARAWLLLAAGIGLFAMLPASAQQAADADDLEDIEEVVVTGSRVARDPNLASVSPMTTVTAQDFEFAGTARTEDLLNDLPSIYAGQESGQANGATGTATIDLRGLSTTRTLVLVNGRRLPPGGATQGGFAADINQVPTALIERVDVLTGGSSATYGSDAVAGVVNFITRQDFEGFRVDLQTSGYRHSNSNGHVQSLLEARRSGLAANNDPSAEGYEAPPSTVNDGEIDTIALMFGFNTDDERGNLTGYYTYRDVNAVLQRDRDYSRCPLQGGNTRCGGSGTIPNGRFTDFGTLSRGAIPMPMGGCPEGSMERTLADGTMQCILGAQQPRSAVPKESDMEKGIVAGMCTPPAVMIPDPDEPGKMLCEEPFEIPVPSMPSMVEKARGLVDGVCPAGRARVQTNNDPDNPTFMCQALGGFAYDFIPTTGEDAEFVARPSTLLYNYNPTNFYQRPDKNTSAGFSFHFDITDNVEVYSEVNYADNHTQAQIAYSGAFFVTDDLPCGNPLMSDQQRMTLCGQLGLSSEQRISNLGVARLNFNDNGTITDKEVQDATGREKAKATDDDYVDGLVKRGPDALGAKEPLDSGACPVDNEGMDDEMQRISFTIGEDTHCVVAETVEATAARLEASFCPSDSKLVEIGGTRLCASDVPTSGNCPAGNEPITIGSDTLCVDLVARGPASLFIGKRNVEGGPRSNDRRHTSLRGVLGFRGSIGENWTWDAYTMRSEVSFEETYNNDLSITRIIRALDVVEDAEGNPVCRSVAEGYDTACVPWNLFHGQGLKDDVEEGITQAALDYLRTPLFSRGTTDLSVTSFYFAGNDLWQFPGAHAGSSLVVGFETRSVSVQRDPDLGFRNGDGAGQGGGTLPISGEYDADELFGELVMPVVQGASWAEDLTLELAYRYSDYTNEETHTYKFGVVYSPHQDWTLRATAQRAVRAPNVYELFLGLGNNLTDIADPCADVERAEARADSDAEEATLEQCMRTGVTETQYKSDTVPSSPAGQYNFLQGGNPDLVPEESDTLSIGVVAQPSWAPGLNFTVDYFDISVEKAIDAITPQTILDKCLDGSVPAICEFINRAPSNGNLWLGSPGDANYGHIEAKQVNLGFLETSGFDIKVDYTLDTNLGSIRFSTNATYLLAWDQEEFAGAGVDECVGHWSGGCGSPTFEFQNNFRTTWFTPWELDITLSWRHLSGVDSLTSTNVNADAVDYFDLAGAWRPSFLEGASVRFGINNLLDEEPPIFGDPAGPSINGNGNTFPGFYDALGQYWFVGLSYVFE